MTTNSSAAGNLYQARTGPKFQHQNSVNSLPRCQDVFKLIWKEEEMLHHGKHAPIPILSPVAGIKLEMS